VYDILLVIMDNDKYIVCFATDHAGYHLKEELLIYVRDELGYNIHDCGAYDFDKNDDYPDFVHCTARMVSDNHKKYVGIILGGSGQGEAIVANRYRNVRAVVYYGESLKKQTDESGDTIDVIESTRAHNNANILSIGARFVDDNAAKRAVKRWLRFKFQNENERHVRRIAKIENVLDKNCD
jgi:ribose 5-phosphate isomerase B